MRWNRNRSSICNGILMKKAYGTGIAKRKKGEERINLHDASEKNRENRCLCMAWVVYDGSCSANNGLQGDRLLEYYIACRICTVDIDAC